MRHKIIFFISLLLIMAFPASAATIQASEEYSLVDGEVVEGDLYVAGGDITISGVVKGDLITVGGSVLVNGGVESDTLVLGGAVDVLGITGDDLRILGGQIRVGDSVAGDAVIAGGFVHILSSVVVEEDLIVTGGKIVIDGDVRGNLKVYGGEVVINGMVNGNTDLFTSDKITLGASAVLSGDLTYTSPLEVFIEDGGVVTGIVTFNETRITKDVETFVGALFGLLFITKILALLTVGLLGVFVFRKFSNLLITRALNNLAVDTLRGLILLVIMPVLIIFFFVTTIGFFVGVLGSLIFITLMILAKVYTGVVFGALLSKWFHKEVTLNWQWTIVGITLLQVVGLIPIIGQLVIFIAFLVTFGSLSHLLYSRFWLNRV